MRECIICQNITDSKKHPKTNEVFHFCEHCDFIQKDTAYYLTEKEEHAHYNWHENSIEDLRYVAYFVRFLEAAVFPFVSRGKKGFDFGSGPSPVLAQLMERDYGYHFTLYDKFYARDNRYTHEEFDLITATEVIEHIANPLEVFKEWVSLMKEDSVLAVMTLFHPKEETDFWNWAYIHDKTHISLFTQKTMIALAEKVGLEIIYCDNHRYTSFRKSPIKSESLEQK